jgi:hypothetical protein
MEGNIVVLVAGAILALLFGYVPGLRQWFEALDGVRKAQVMAGLLLLAAAGTFGASCYTPWVAVECTEAGFWQLVELFIMAVIANQATYMLAVRPSRTAQEQA